MLDMERNILTQGRLAGTSLPNERDKTRVLPLWTRGVTVDGRLDEFFKAWCFDKPGNLLSGRLLDRQPEPFRGLVFVEIGLDSFCVILKAVDLSQSPIYYELMSLA